MTIQARIVADSANPSGDRITSFVLVYPRFIHSEVMTHRAFSRNAASSRAIPVEKMISNITANPAGPIFWGMNQKGMQASQEATPEVQAIAVKLWNLAMQEAVVRARQLLDLGIHKQIANRLLEPFAHMTTLVTATDFGNFFNLRAHPDAQPEFQELAYQMLDCYEESSPRILDVGDWHLPFADQYIPEGLSIEQLLKISTARAARTSYVNFEGDFAHEKDYDLHDRLATSGHWSPFEHPACAMSYSVRSGNFVGWFQYRKKFPNENQKDFSCAVIKSRRGKK
jgi:thymidylate synthase ThyX